MAVMREHKIALFHSREAELLAEAEERDQRIEELEVSPYDLLRNHASPDWPRLIARHLWTRLTTRLTSVWLLRRSLQLPILLRP